MSAVNAFGVRVGCELPVRGSGLLWVFAGGGFALVVIMGSNEWWVCLGCGRWWWDLKERERDLWPVWKFRE